MRPATWDGAGPPYAEAQRTSSATAAAIDLTMCVFRYYAVAMPHMTGFTEGL